MRPARARVSPLVRQLLLALAPERLFRIRQGPTLDCEWRRSPARRSLPLLSVSLINAFHRAAQQARNKRSEINVNAENLAPRIGNRSDVEACAPDRGYG